MGKRKAELNAGGQNSKQAKVHLQVRQCCFSVWLLINAVPELQQPCRLCDVVCGSGGTNT
jgi:hypothetical protein